jgi:hypothetical protein
MMVASGASFYNWTPATGLSSTFTDTVYANPTSSTTYTVIGFNAAGCSSSASIRVTNSQSPNVSATPALVTVCQGDSVTLSAVATNPGGGPGGGQQVAATFVWAPYNIVGSSITLPFDSSTIVYAVGTNLAGCSGTNSVDSVLIDVVISPSAGAVVVSDSVICGGPATVQLSMTGGSVGAYTWQYSSDPFGPWTPTTNQGLNIESDTIDSPLYFICVASCSNGQTDTSDVQFVNISNDPPPVVVLNATQAYYCQASNPVTLVASGAPFYSWAPATGLNSTFTDTVYSAPLQSITYIVTGFDSLGCSDTASVRVSVRPNPVVSISPAAPSIFEGDSVVLTATATNVGPGGTMNYSWDPLGLSGNQISVSPAPGSYQFVVIGVSSFGCSNSNSIDTVTVTVDPFTTADFNYTVNGNTVTFANNSLNALTYSWDFGDGSSSTQQTPVHSYTNGIYDVTLIAEGLCSTDTFNLQLVINATGLDELSAFSPSLHPNPVIDLTTLTFDGTPERIELMDFAGKVLSVKDVLSKSDNQIRLDLSGVSSGVYVIRLMNRESIGIVRFLKL